MKVTVILLPIDTSLTPENANQRGYKWVADVAYDETEEIPPTLMKSFLDLLNDGYMFGCALHPVSNMDKGLYEPIEM